MAGFYGQFIDTVGMEYESTALTKEFVSERVMRAWINAMGNSARRIKVTRDASIEFVAEWVRTSSGPALISRHTDAIRLLKGAGQGNTKVLGFELCLEPMEISELEATLYPMMYTLRKFGDYTSRRASVHYHFGFANNLRLLKNLLAICLNVEPLLFRLGGMGGTFRGAANLAAYARPLMSSLAVPVHDVMSIRKNHISMQEFAAQHPTASPSELMALRKAWHVNTSQPRASTLNSRWVQIINPLAALEAKTIDDFWAAFGVDYPTGGTVKYHPARYHGCNFFAVAAHGTMEFRHFNQHMDPSLLTAIAKFLRGLVELSTVVSKADRQIFEILPPREEISMSDAVIIMQRLMHLMNEKELEALPSESEVSMLLDVIDQSHFEPLPETPVLCHIVQSTDFRIDAETANRGRLIPVSNILEPQHVDIHNLEHRKISIFD